MEKERRKSTVGDLREALKDLPDDAVIDHVYAPVMYAGVSGPRAFMDIYWETEEYRTLRESYPHGVNMPNSRILIY